MSSFPLRRSRWTTPMLGIFGASRPVAELEESAVRIGMGALGGGRVPLELVTGISTMRWPWWGGLGVRIARGLTAFVGSSGTLVVLDLSAPIKLRAPLPWKTRRVGIAVGDPERFIEQIVAARGGEIHQAGALD